MQTGSARRPTAEGLCKGEGMEQVHIEKNTVQETLVLPLYARKLCTERYADLFQDPKALALMERIDYDFSEIEKKSGASQRFAALEVAMRQSDLAFEIREYLQEHPFAAVVNLGCGLDQTAEACDNGTCKIYNIDYPDVIAVRNQLLPVQERVTNIAADLNDISWFDEIDHENGAVLFAAGVFYYFKRQQALALFSKMSDHFKGGKLVFDIAGKRAVKLMTKSWIKQVGIKDVEAFFYVEKIEKDLKPYLPEVKISARGYMLGYHDLKTKSVSAFFRLLAKAGDNIMKMRILRLEFAR